MISVNSKLEVKTKCGFIALLGLPNAGKSLLLNQILNRKVSIVNHKRNTTRIPIKGILNHENSQVIFIDTPGIDTSSNELLKQMINFAWEEAKNNDVIALVVDSNIGLSSYVRDIISKIQNFNKPKYLILNKIDLINKPDLLILAKQANELMEFNDIFMVSAIDNDGLNDLIRVFSNIVPEGNFVYPRDMHTDLPLEIWSSEITREEAMLACHQEVPYGLTIDTTKIDYNKKGIFIYQEVKVANKSHKMIFIGKNGQKIKNIGIHARSQMSKFLDQEVHLFLDVKIRKGKISLFT